MDHFYYSIPGYFTFEGFYRMVVRNYLHSRKPHCVEVGVAHGRSAAFLAVELANAYQEPRLDLVDRFVSPTISEVAETLSPATPVIGRLIESLSWDAAAQYADSSLDFVYIDADHTYESARRDIVAWWPKVKYGGIIGGHDFTPEYPGVIQAVIEEIRNFHVDVGEPWENGKVYPTWWVRK